MNKVWYLLVTYEEDDWKSRYGAGDPTLFVADSAEKCQARLRELILEDISSKWEELTRSQVKKIPKEVRNWFAFTTCDRTDEEEDPPMNATFREEKEKEEGSFPYQLLYEYVAKGEYVSYSWKYCVDVTEVN